MQESWGDARVVKVKKGWMETENYNSEVLNRRVLSGGFSLSQVFALENRHEH